MEWEYSLQPFTAQHGRSRTGKVTYPAQTVWNEPDPMDLLHNLDLQDLSKDPDPAEMREVRARHAQRLAIGIPAAQEWARQRLETR